MMKGTKSFDSFATSLPKVESDGPKRHTQSPVTTGTSVLAFAYSGGVIMAADTLASYGSLARYRDVQRLYKVNDEVVLGIMGDYADYQYLAAIIEQMEIDEHCKDDGFRTSARSLHSWLTRVLYNKRCKFDPLWCTFVVAGVDKTPEGVNKPYLGFVDKLGTSYVDPIIATGYASMLATPLIRKVVEEKGGSDKLSEQDARKLMKEALELMYYRDARAFNKYTLSIIPSTGEPAKVEGPLTLEGNWAVAHMISGYE